MTIKADVTIELQSSFERILATYRSARSGDSFSGRHPITDSFRNIQAAIQALSSVRGRTGLSVRWSVGQGNWTNVPWIALLDRKETDTTQHGVYVVYLFRQDMSGVYLTFNQGVTDPFKRLGRTEGRKLLKATAADIRRQCASLGKAGFRLDDRLDLTAASGVGADYEVSTIAYKYYEAGNVPSDGALASDLEAVLFAYDAYLALPARMPIPAPSTRSWIFQSNPDRWDLGEAMSYLQGFTYLVRQHADEVAAGDKVYLWQSGPDAGILGTAIVEDQPTIRRMDEAVARFAKNPDGLIDPQLRVALKIVSKLIHPLLRRDLANVPALQDLSILRAPQGTNFSLTPLQAKTIDELIAEQQRTKSAAPVADLRAIVDAFAQCLTTSNIDFGPQHLQFTRTFVASLAAKRFLILTGLSGSGKTQIALHFGQWCGTDRYRVVPVRPDWTGPEALLGYEDALLPVVEGRRAWCVPEALEFILRATGDPTNPYALILDEMNLAHVERYFADVLSGMESDVACLPNLELESGLWRAVEDESAKIRFPDNLFIIGTVNVDETTYMFSPKVLDRANTIEFKVPSSALRFDAHRPLESEPGDDALVRGFLQIARDKEWQFSDLPRDREDFDSALRSLHDLLSEGAFEFGHRIAHEAVRFAAMLAGAGEPSWLAALDLVLLQKIMPRLHGSRRRLEPTLSALGRYCVAPKAFAPNDMIASERFDPLAPLSTTAALPMSFDKVKRMTRSLRSNQFASFSE